MAATGINAATMTTIRLMHILLFIVTRPRATYLAWSIKQFSNEFGDGRCDIHVSAPRPSR